MHTIPTHITRRLGQRLSSLAHALPAVFALAALAVPARSLAQTPTFNALVTTHVNVGSAFPDVATVGDINGDGKLDAIATGGDNPSVLHVMLGNGNGTFTEHGVQLPQITAANVINLHPSLTGFLPVSVGGFGTLAAVDVNGDGKLDLVCIESVGINFTNYSFIGVLLNTGNDANGVPQFAATHHWLQFLGVRPVTVGDLNGDGQPDVIIGTSGGTFQVWLNQGGGTLAPGQVTGLTPGAGASTGQGVITDLNGDGKADFVTTSTQNGGANIFFGNGDGTLQAPVYLPNGAVSVAVADVNGDGKPDLLMGNLTSGSEGLYVYLNAGGGAFGAPALYPISGLAGFFLGGGSVAVSDINGDGKLDAVLSNLTNNTVAVLLGDGSGGFGAPTSFATAGSPTWVFVGDFDGDGKPDIGVDLRNGRNFGVLTNTTPAPVPAQLFFTDALTGPGSPNLAAIPAGKYGYTAAGLQRAQSSSSTDRPIITTALNTYLAASTGNFGADITVTLTSPDLLFFGLGQGDADANYFSEPDHAFYFRVHSNWSGNNSIQGDVRAHDFLAIRDESVYGYYTAGSTITLRITRVGDTITMAVVGGVSTTYSLSAYQAALGLTASNTRVFFGNTSAGSVFSNLKIYALPNDVTPPVITAPADITAEATSATGAPVTFTATATDDVDGAVPVTASPASGSTFPITTTIVGLAAADKAGNTASASFKVTVQDTLPPAIGTAPVVAPVEATSSSGAVVNFTVPSATDIVDGTDAVVATPASGSTFALGNTTVTLKSTDAHNNSSSKTFTVTVQDTTAPSIAVPTVAAVEATSAAGAIVNYLAATATDAVGVTSLTYSKASGTTFAIGTTAVIVTAKDAAGNTSTKTFNVTVKDSTPPAITATMTAKGGGDDESAQFFTIAFAATDAVGVKTLTALLNGVTVTNGQVVQLQTIKSGAQSVKRDDGKLQIKATSFALVVTATDVAGNITTKTVVPVFVKNGKDDENKKGGDDNGKGDDKKGDDDQKGSDDKGKGK